MPTYQVFSAQSGSVLVEVVSAAASTTGGASLESLLSPVIIVGGMLGAQLEKVPENARPSVVELTFGVSALSDGKVAITLGAGEGPNVTFAVRVRWGSEGGGFSMPKMPI
jgi:hypothetical protein